MSNNLAYQEERRAELIDGKTVMMSPTSTNHTFVSGHNPQGCYEVTFVKSKS